VFSINVLITGTKITALAKISLAQLSAQKYLSVMLMCLAMCLAQWIQQEYILCLADD
jgi:hypothetical protein